MHAHTKTLGQLFRDLLFADDAALVAHTERAIQQQTSCFAEVALLFRREVSLKKTDVLHQPACLKEYRLQHITIARTELKAVYQFIYLGCTINHIRHQDRWGSRQQTGQSKRHSQQTIQKSMEQ